jgi:hypothetical protein
MSPTPAVIYAWRIRQKRTYSFPLIYFNLNLDLNMSLFLFESILSNNSVFTSFYIVSITLYHAKFAMTLPGQRLTAAFLPSSIINSPNPNAAGRK